MVSQTGYGPVRDTSIGLKVQL